MHRGRAILYCWLPLAGLAVALCGVVYVAVQQVWRHAANDPQIQMAEDIAGALGRGALVASVVPATGIDIRVSLAPFVTVLDEAGAIVASSGRLHGEIRSVPAGVIDHARQNSAERVTWQPEPGVRIATVVQHYSRTADGAGGFVLVGRSLRENEQRTGQFQHLIALACAGVLAGLLALVATTEFLFSAS
jgi:hypothetical protein